MATILIVDEDRDLIERVTQALKHEGYEVVTAASGRVGRAIGLRLRPDVALIDAHAKDVNGFHLLRSFRRRSPGTAVILMSANATPEMAVQAMESGAFSFLAKPLRMEKLLPRVRQVAAHRNGTGRCGKQETPQYARGRVMPLVARIVTSPDDLPSTPVWAKLVAHSTGAIRNWCRTAHVWPSNLLSLGRMLRLAHRYNGNGDVSDHLKAIDDRTILRLLSLGIEDGPPIHLPCSIDEILDRQHWYTDPDGLRILRDAIRDELRQAAEREREREREAGDLMITCGSCVLVRDCVRRSDLVLVRPRASLG